MSRFVFLGTVLVLCSQISDVTCEEDPCRQLDFRAALAFRGKRLINHVIKAINSAAKDFCGALCFMEPNCVSYNMLVSSDSSTITTCELNNSTHFEHPDDLLQFPNSTYRGTKNACGKKPCLNNAICQVGFTHKGYRCVCAPGYKGQDCNEDVDECRSGEYNCDANALCKNIHGSYNCTCKQGLTGDGHTCTDIDECAAIDNECFKGGANCTNTEGSYNCTCQFGHVWHGTKCEDIDECAANDNECIQGGASCTNTEGSYNCTCQFGHVWDGTKCEVDVCQLYTVLEDVDRNITHVTQSPKCDSNLIHGWYRFLNVPGIRMPTSCPPEFRCGTNFPGWLNGNHPTVNDGIVTREVCVHRNDCCKQNIFIKVKNCGSFYVYHLLDGLTCSWRYCYTSN